MNVSEKATATERMSKQASEKKVHGIRIVENVLASILVWTAIFKLAALWNSFIARSTKQNQANERKKEIEIDATISDTISC